MEVKVKLYLVDEEGDKFMGIGVLWLLEKIETEGSLRGSAAALGISYSKAYGMVRNLEKSLGVPVLVRKKGGASHDGATLTPFGRQFIELYRDFQAKSKKLVEGPFADFRTGLAKLLETVDDMEPMEGESGACR
ncbi:MAG: LysR family transcriptional regulator [Sphaerochaetaceae bacterium]|nr:LysR family transcriptional regulator [Sphaerochaetaceae bacterium]